MTFALLQVATITLTQPVVGSQCLVLDSDATVSCDSTGNGVYNEACVLGAMCQGLPSAFVASLSTARPPSGATVVQNTETGGTISVLGTTTATRALGQVLHCLFALFPPPEALTMNCFAEFHNFGLI
jgi:hypothetical protein